MSIAPKDDEAPLRWRRLPFGGHLGTRDGEPECIDDGDLGPEARAGAVAEAEALLGFPIHYVGREWGRPPPWRMRDAPGEPITFRLKIARSRVDRS